MSAKHGAEAPRHVPAETGDIARAAAQAAGAEADEATYRELIEAAALPPEALPSDGFFTAGAEADVDRARAAAVAAARAAVLAGADAAPAQDVPASDALYRAALADAGRRLARLKDAFATVEDGNALQERRAAAIAAGNAEPLKIGVLISGSGTNLQALIDRIADGALNAQIVLVISSRPSAAGLKRAAAAGIQTLALSKEIYAADPWDADEVIATELRRAGAEYIIMAGYMRKVHEPLLALWPHRVVNLHPALLPSFQGAHGIDDAFARGVKVTGVTVHFANAVYDQGPIIAQEPVRVEEGWTVEELEAAIHAVEHRLYPEVVQLLADGRVHVRDNGTVAIASATA